MVCKYCIFQAIGNLRSNHICRYLWFLHQRKPLLQPLTTLLIFFVLVCKLYKSVYKLLHCGSVKINKNCLYWKVFSTDIYRNIILKCLLLFQLYLSVNCMSISQASKKLRQDLYLTALIIVFYGKFMSNFPVLL